MKRLRALLILSLLIVAAGIGLDMAARNQIVLYHPDMALPTPQDVGLPQIQTASVNTKDGLVLTAWFLQPRESDKQVLMFFMGDTGSLADRISDFTPYIDNGYGIFLVGYRGFGGNPGTPSEKGLYRDARASIAWLHRHGYSDNQIVLYGHSLGTGIAVQMGTEISAYAVVLEAPYTTLPDTVFLNLPLISANWFMKDRYDNMAKIGQVKAPLLIVQGDEDEVIPEAQGKALFKAAKAPKQARFIPHGGHSDLYSYGEAAIVMNFLEDPAGTSKGELKPEARSSLSP